jgi:coiled-coil-helix-coiled-coil-helix domain-containing protein 2
MPRQGRSGGGGGRSRPSVAPSRPAPAKQQSRPATTSAYPPANAKAGPPAAPIQAQGQSQGPGLFGQMASTAAYVFKDENVIRS